MRLSVKSPSGPKYVDLANKLREQIQFEYEPGSRFPTMSELREVHNVSISTMERAYSLLEQEGLLMREQGRGTFVMAPPQKARFVIAVSNRLLHHQRDPYWFYMLKGISQAALEHHAEIIFPSHERGSLSNGVNGMIVFDEPVEEFGPTPAGFPFMSLVTSVPGAYSVIADDYSGAHQLTEHLLRLGHERIAVLYPYGEEHPVAAERLKARQDVLREAGIEPDPSLVRTYQPQWTVQENYSEIGYTAMVEWLDAGWRDLGCTAVMAYNDGMAVGAMRALQEAGITVPGAVSVTGFDANPAFDYFHTRLTTARVPLLDLGRGAVHLLIRRLEGDNRVPSLTRLPTHLVKGESTATCLRFCLG